jgi:hypothetical protein
MTSWYDPSDVNLDASYDFESDIDMNFESCLDLNSYVNVEHNIDVCVDIDGNDAVFAIDIQAFGDNTSTELNLVVVVEDNEWSSITASGYAAAD